MSTNLSQQLKDVGLAGSITLTETGEQITLAFGKGEREKHITGVIGGLAVEGVLRLEEIEDADEGEPNLRLVFTMPAHQTLREAQRRAQQHTATKAAPPAKLAEGELPPGGIERLPDHKAPGPTNSIGEDVQPAKPAAPAPATPTASAKAGPPPHVQHAPQHAKQAEKAPAKSAPAVTAKAAAPAAKEDDVTRD